MRILTRSTERRWFALGLALTAGVSGLGGPILSEFLAANRSVLADEDGLFADWIEIHNPEDVPLALAGYHLTDNAANLTKWTFPAVTLAPGEYLVVFASGKNRLDPAAPLHTNFQLAADGEYLALVAPDGATVLSAFTPVYPPQFENASYGLDTEGASPAWSYFATPTPGRPNGRGLRAGPILQPLEPHPPQPVQGPLTVAVRGLPVNGPVAAVELHYRRMFAAEAMLSMRDDGTGGDARAGDGVWTAVIPEEAFGPAEMTRWRFVATDDDGAETRNPPFRAPLDSPQYFGTVAHDDRIQTLLPVLHWFTSNPAGAGTSTGSRGAVYYEGEFYDNVLFTLHGQSSAGFPKKSYNLDFNRPQRFRWSPTAPRVADIDLLTNWADKSKVRHVLAYEVMREAGVPAHFAFTVRVQQNGRFFSTADLVEDADEIYLERAGLNPDGALYKVYDNLLSKAAGNTATSGVEKKTRRWESNSDLQALINGLAQSGPALERYLYDHIDLPRCVNLLAVNSVIRNIDMHSKNWYVYRDTGRSDEWAILPWDLDLSHGRVWNTQNTYFDNALYTDGYVVNSTSIRLVSLMFANPAMRAMILRRIRTLSDRFLQPLPAPGTPETALYYERRLNEQSALIDPPSIVPSDARLDFEKWGSWLQGGTMVRYTNSHPAVETMAEAIQRWKTEYLPGRRRYIYNTQVVGRGGEIPLPQTDPGPLTNYAAFVTAGAPVQVLVPTTGTLGTTWTGDPAFEPFDTAGWRNGTTGVGYERATGYESLIGTDVNDAMRNNNSVYLRIRFEVSDPAAFQRLQLRMKFDDGFVAFLNGTRVAAANAPTPLQWNSAATISREANPAAYTLYDVSEGLSALRSGPNVLAIQGLNDNVDSSDMIIVPELYGGKVLPPTTREPKLEFGTIEFSPTSGNQDEEFIQVRNPHSLAVDVSGWRLTGAVEHTFLGGTVLPAEGTIYVCPNAAAFRARRVSPKGGEGLFVQGGYQGRLSSRGGTLTLLDAAGAVNSTASFAGDPSDVQRFLVVSELLYHPVGDGLAEFLELLNISRSVTLDLRSVRFTQGVEFDFADGAITSLPPGGRVLVVRNLAAFTAVYGPHLPVAGVFQNDTALSNGGELIRLEDVRHGIIREFTYDDAAPWPTEADAGWSLVLIAPETDPDHSLAANWRASARRGGSPGWPDDPRFPADPTGDADGNGEPDLLDYLLGNDPGRPPLAPRLTVRPAQGSEPTLLRLSCAVNATAEGATPGVSFSTNLIIWQDAAPHLELVARELLGHGQEQVTWEVKAPLRDEPRVFLRLRADAPFLRSLP